MDSEVLVQGPAGTPTPRAFSPLLLPKDCSFPLRDLVIQPLTRVPVVLPGEPLTLGLGTALRRGTWSWGVTVWEDDLARSALPLAGGQPGPEILVGERDSPVKGRQEGKAGMVLTLCKTIKVASWGCGLLHYKGNPCLLWKTQTRRQH